ncbi:MAG: hypothetical protein ACI841_004582 [Planctomycetota bacterium]|jgi:uncharacterized protein (DUF885 family)
MTTGPTCLVRIRLQAAQLVCFACALTMAVSSACATPQDAGLLSYRTTYVGPQVEVLATHGMREVIEYFEAERGALLRAWDVESSPLRSERQREFLGSWQGQLAALDIDEFDVDDKLDWKLLTNRVDSLASRVALDEQRWHESAALIPFAGKIADFQEARRALTPLNARAAADALTAMKTVVDDLRKRVVRMDSSTDEGEESSSDEAATDQNRSTDDELIETARLTANRAASQVRSLRRSLSSWFRYRDGYDPLFSWWCQAPFDELDAALERYAKHLRETVAGVDEDDSDTILGDPIGRTALQAELEREWIAYSPEELVEIARRELSWCDARMHEAAQKLGFDDWRAAQEHVKGLHVEPGHQPEMIRDLAFEAIDFLEEHELVTIPTFAKSSWRMEMMSPARQKLTPYFTGGEVISVSYPTASMDHADKLMSMRGNNEHFSRATVHHELIPGHHLQRFMTSRYRPYRRPFGTPFWLEGWALYWEMLLWDQDYARSAEDRIGMLFWRKHRCARIIFSLGFHLGEMTAEECIDLLVDRVGHERRNATAEVRRSVQGGYGPLYQAAYMVGGLQLRRLHEELVTGGSYTNRSFHDAILREASIPIELLRYKLRGEGISKEANTSWRFYSL